MCVVSADKTAGSNIFSTPLSGGFREQLPTLVLPLGKFRKFGIGWITRHDGDDEDGFVNGRLLKNLPPTRQHNII
jgi:hypothetical protein